ncbi:GNAT family N-acetyltransferase [Methanobacterium alcaliphilum]|uniref:GNAT family N-acetyltransferase n=1 Tax=Methanobacterium alcaliphilum TaxID=392018 RepID=UPI00200A40EE|nr:GNAT family N-acetyltransferase [Methanobacterium alcaliphilum]MCK9152561.1 GNAT family N-acetyltransferase [Methanobacterium alcaliphilum]
MTDLKKNITYVTTKDIDLIEPLWGKIKIHHQNISQHFSDKYKKTSFINRRKELLDKTSINIDLAKDMDMDSYIGYCISSISQDIGEIDSIFVEKKYRSQGIGQKLMERALNWMRENGSDDIKIVVAVGNEELLPFYKNFGFFPRHMVLENKNTP